MKFQKALVTGGAGFIGSYIVEALLRRGIAVTVLDDFSTGKKETVHPAATLVEGDVCNLQLVTEVVADVDIVFHQAAKVSIRNSIGEFYEDFKVNVLGTVNVLKGISQSPRVRRLIYASSMAVYSDSESLPIKEDYSTEPISPYGIAKLTSEKYCLQIGKQCGFDVIVLRYFNTFGRGQSLSPYVGVITIFINRALQNKPPIIFGDGEQIRDFVFVEDVAEANMLAMDADIRGGIFNVGSGKGTSISKLARIVVEKINPAITPEYAPKQAGEPNDSIADISRAAELLNFRPRAGFEEKLDEVIAWWKNHRGRENVAVRIAHGKRISGRSYSGGTRGT